MLHEQGCTVRSYLPARDAYFNPAVTVKSYREVLTADVESGAEQIRFITEVPHPGTGSAWDWWGRYACAVNEIFADLPVWAICTYDQRTAPPAVLDEVRSHPSDPALGPLHRPPESRAPLVRLVGPSLSQARRVAAAVAGPSLGAEAGDNLAFGGVGEFAIRLVGAPITH